jgi:PPOX class probable F420-dependent enzyme
MVNQRERIQLSEAEQRELIEEARILQVASINRDGTPHLVPMWFALDDEGLIVFTTYGKAQKIANLERDARMTVLIEAGDAYNELRGVSMDAEAEVVRDPQVTARVLALVGAKYAGRPRPEASSAYKRVTVRVRPLRMRSWDHRKL